MMIAVDLKLEKNKTNACSRIQKITVFFGP